MSKLDEMISSFPEAAKESIKGKKLDEVECVIADLPGIARGKAVPASKFSRQNSFHLPDSIFFRVNKPFSNSCSPTRTTYGILRLLACAICFFILAGSGYNSALTP